MMSTSSILLGSTLFIQNTFRSGCGFQLLRLHSDVKLCNMISIRRHSLQPVLTKAMAKRREAQSKPGVPNLKFLDNTNTGFAKIQSKTLGAHDLRSLQQHKSDQIIANAPSFGWPAVVIAFDIETTGFGREARIIEVAFRDLDGGENSALETLVNPEVDIKNSYIHGITTQMVTKPGVPRMKDLIPILLAYVQSRRVHGKPVVFVAHNGRTFDIPFFIREFNRCQAEFPLDWLFIDTLPLARKLIKIEDGKKRTSVSLESLREYYRIPLEGRSHRAMQDVTTLCKVLQKMTFEFKLSVADLMESAFRASDLIDNSMH